MAIAYAPLVYDRVKETSTSTGTSSFTLAGATTGYRTFFSAAGNGVRLYYAIENPSAGEWEVGIGYIVTNTTLIRETILASSNSNTTVSFGAGTKNVFCTAPAAPLQDKFNSPNPNLLINGGFDIFQRQTPGTLTARSDDTYGPDRWYVLTQTASIQVQRETDDGGSWVTLKQNQAAAQRFGLAQIVEAKFTAPYFGRTLRFQCELAASGSTADMYVSILQYAGTADTVTSDVVNDWTSGTYTPNNFFINTPLSVLGTAGISLPNDSTFYPVDVTGTTTENHNIIVFLWTEDTITQDVEIMVRRAMLTDSSVPCRWMPRTFAEEVALCERYYQKGYDLDVAPGSTGSDGEAGSLFWWSPIALGNPTTMTSEHYRTRMRSAPTVTLYSPGSGTSGKVRDNTATDRSAFAYNSTQDGYYSAYSDGTTIASGSFVYWNYTADNEL